MRVPGSTAERAMSACGSVGGNRLAELPRPVSAGVHSRRLGRLARPSRYARVMDTYERILNLRAIRDYEDRMLSDEDLNKILEAARWTGSSKNLQNWSFVVVTDEATRLAVAECGDYTAPVSNAAAVIVIVILRHERDAIVHAGHSGAFELARIAGRITGYFALSVAGVLLSFGFIDYLVQRWQHESQLRMSHTELKEERKQEEGDPHVRARIKKLQREMASLESDYKLKAKALQEDQRRRGAEEEQKLVQKIRQAIQDVAKREGYDIVLDANAVLHASPKDDLSTKVISAVK